MVALLKTCREGRKKKVKWFGVIGWDRILITPIFGFVSDRNCPHQIETISDRYKVYMEKSLLSIQQNKLFVLLVH